MCTYDIPHAWTGKAIQDSEPDAEKYYAEVITDHFLTYVQFIGSRVRENKIYVDVRSARRICTKCSIQHPPVRSGI